MSVTGIALDVIPGNEIWGDLVFLLYILMMTHGSAVITLDAFSSSPTREQAPISPWAETMLSRRSVLGNSLSEGGSQECGVLASPRLSLMMTEPFHVYLGTTICFNSSRLI